MKSLPSFVRSPEGNGVIERFFRTLKDQLLWLRYDDDEEALKQALYEFRDRYNAHWINLEMAVGRKKDTKGIGVPGEIKKCVVTLWVMRHFFIVRGAPRACVDFCDPTAVSRFKQRHGYRTPQQVREEWNQKPIMAS